MKRLVPLAIGLGVVGVIAIILAIVGWNWSWFALANGAFTILLLVLFRGSVTGADPDLRRRASPGSSAAHVTGPFDPEVLARSGGALEPDPDAAAVARADDVETGFSFLWTAAAPAVAAVLAVVFYL